jgi:hypothetical protein
MKPPNKQLLDDLTEDSAAPDFRAEVLHKTLRSARRRRHIRQLSGGLGTAMLAGLLVFAFKKTQEPAISLNQMRPQTPTGTSLPPQNRTPVVSTPSDAVLTIVQTSESVPPREINDKELAALLSRQEVGLVRYASGETEVIR